MEDIYTHILGKIYKTLNAYAPTYYLFNPKGRDVTFPYITYKPQTTPLENGREGMFLDIDIFHSLDNINELESLASRLKRELDGKIILDRQCLIQMEFRNADVIDTGNVNIQRRWIELYLKLDFKEDSNDFTNNRL